MDQLGASSVSTFDQSCIHNRTPEVDQLFTQADIAQDDQNERVIDQCLDGDRYYYDDDDDDDDCSGGGVSGLGGGVSGLGGDSGGDNYNDE